MKTLQLLCCAGCTAVWMGSGCTDLVWLILAAWSGTAWWIMEVRDVIVAKIEEGR